jgi:hypothetical protein
MEFLSNIILQSMNLPRLYLISACFVGILAGLSSCDSATPTAEKPEVQTSAVPAKPATKPSAKPAAMAEKIPAAAEKKETVPVEKKEAIKSTPAVPAKAAPTPAAPAKAAAASGPETISFAKGATSAVAKGSVVRGDRKTYIVNAAKNQSMTLSVSALESNAVVDLIGPDGKVIKQGATTVKQVLPATGDYQVVVGGTRGNATYEVKIAIE